MNVKEALIHIKCGVIYLIITVILCIGLFILTACIPTTAIEKSVQDSSTYFLREDLFKQLKYGYRATTCDNYADCILVSLAYELDSSHPFVSIIKAEYLQEENENVNVTLKKVVLSKEANRNTNKVSYSRYWHGSLVLLRPLLVLGDIQVVRQFLAIITAFFLISNLLILYKQYSKSMAIHYLLAFGAVQGTVMLFCVNYIMNFLIVNVMLFLIERKMVQREEDFYYLMVVGGTVTSFCDFLTTETITLTLPFLIYWTIREKEMVNQSFSSDKPMKNAVLSGVSWGIGYGFMFLLKWFLVYLVLGKEALTDGLQQATMRIHDGSMTQALKNNIAAMFCLRNYEFNLYSGILAVVFALFFSVLFVLAMRQKNQYLNAMILISLVPYLRFVVIKNHSEIHYFFTYRAQITTWIVIFICIEKLWIQKMERKKKKLLVKEK